MEKTKQSLHKATRVVNLTFVVAIHTATAVLQYYIGDLAPEVSHATTLQSWMTFLALIFCFLGVTEVLDNTELMIMKPAIYQKALAREERLRQHPEEA